MVLVDTSVWIDFFAGRDEPHVDALQTPIEKVVRMIASVAIEYDIRLLHNDRDFNHIASHAILGLHAVVSTHRT